jgi:hypothetical protein
VEYVVTEREDTVLATFLEHGAMNRPSLGSRSGYGEKALTVLRGLRTKYDGAFAPHIRFPGGKGKGGYHVSVRRA